jgi:hypothetical protein
MLVLYGPDNVDNAKRFTFGSFLFRSSPGSIKDVTDVHLPGAFTFVVSDAIILVAAVAASAARAARANAAEALSAEQFAAMEVLLRDMENTQTVTCQIRYKLDLSKLKEFEAYARAWIVLIERYGGTHHGYFIPRAAPEGARMSFPQIGSEGPNDIAIALFTFPDEQSYLRYRAMVAADPECPAAAALYSETGCFLSYERLFLQQVERLV